MKSKIDQYYGATEETFEFAKELRQSQTEAEGKLWELIRSRQIRNAKFRRQHPIGPFIADFYCHEFKLVIEVDGSVHDVREVKQYDIGRQFELEELGIKVIRFTNENVIQFPQKVVMKIESYLNEAM